MSTPQHSITAMANATITKAAIAIVIGAPVVVIKLVPVQLPSTSALNLLVYKLAAVGEENVKVGGPATGAVTVAV